MIINGAAAADDTTLAAIAAIDAIPERVTYEDKAIVEAARAAYAKIATTEQQALVTNYADLISAEQRIIALTPTEENPTEAPDQENGGSLAWLVWVIIGLGAAGVVAAVLVEYKRSQPKKPAEKAEEPAEAEEAPAQAENAADQAETEE